MPTARQGHGLAPGDAQRCKVAPGVPTARRVHGLAPGDAAALRKQVAWAVSLHGTPRSTAPPRAGRPGACVGLPGSASITDAPPPSGGVDVLTCPGTVGPKLQSTVSAARTARSCAALFFLSPEGQCRDTAEGQC